ncbi:membrane fusion protein, multidrug efflux system [Novimethylophilus kurashikiensis]|uniref:Membrane fusion protein, multidrug efflux system n=1 Tax=Novimethylophilus kurashikiensis TaxID=1825523 RepID=A0A2R5F3Q0_9PROT|nr:MdtA/MuxA family multidrug efflux RND transporter periplasmic adaptor subunit [Novimethylophilus kurashikiensis]GBG13110.1 membrane fusion protein, multidrug efflux system [Novimethylophilus kurashikiensis]
MPIEKPSEQQSGTRILVGALVLAGIVAGGFFYYRQHAVAPQGESRKFDAKGRPTPVLVAKAGQGDVKVYLDALGTVTPRNAVTVKARVDGQLMQVYFREGQLVKAGELLAEIDPRPFEVQLTQANGQLAKDKAALENAQIDLERYKTLLAQDSIAKQQVDTQEALVRQQRAAVAVDQGQVDSAKLQLSYCRITAPIGGRVGLRAVDPGNMIHASDASGIVTITQLQPITTLFSIPEDQLPAVTQRLKAGGVVPLEAWDKAKLNKLATGSLLTLDNQIDTATGTLKLRGEFKNDDNTLFPNQFVNVRMLVDVLKNAVTIPSAAVQRGRNGDFVFVVTPGKEHSKPDGAAPDNATPPHDKPQDNKPGAAKPDGRPASKVEMRPVKTGVAEGEMIAIVSGLQPGESVVVDGADKLRDGSPVKPLEKMVTGDETSGKAGPGGQNKGGKHRRSAQ